MDITKRKFISFPPKRTFTKVETEAICEVCRIRPAKFLLKNSLLLCCQNYANKCLKIVPEKTLCYGCGKPAAMVQACGPVCGEGTAQVKCPVAAKANHDAQVAGYEKRLQDPRLKKQRQEKFESTMVERYGAKSAVLVPELAQKIKDTNMERYGVEHGPQIPGVFDAVRERYQQSHGVDHWTQISSVQSKRKQTSLKKYGTENPIQAEQIIETRRKNNLEKYGVNHPMQVKEVAAKKYQTWLINQLGIGFGTREWWNKYRDAYKAKHGFDHPNKDPKKAAWWVKNVGPKLYRTHELTLPSGRIVTYQGYEDRAILFLLRSFAEDELVFGGDMSFAWTDSDGDRHTYFPDLCIKPKQTAVEVKSEYTLATSLLDGSLVQKLLAVRLHGWLPVVQLWGSDGGEPLKVLTLDDFSGLY